MLQLADCGLKDLNALQVCNRLGEGIPLYYCEEEEGVLVIICRHGDLPDSHAVTVSRYSITVLYTCIVRERCSDETMNNFVKQTKATQASISPSLLQCMPS